MNTPEELIELIEKLVGVSFDTGYYQGTLEYNPGKMDSRQSYIDCNNKAITLRNELLKTAKYMIRNMGDQSCKK